MSYLALRFEASEAEADRWSDALLEAGALSVDVSDPAAGTAAETPLFGEPGVLSPGSWPTARIVALFVAEVQPLEVLAGLSAVLGLSLPASEIYPVAEQDWVRQTQSQFGPIEVAPDFWIVPTWSTVPVPDATILRLDPGLAFGTGTHPTTRLCLEWLRETLQGGETVLDYGCGSGILAIAARKLGAGPTSGVDVDPQAIAASLANAKLNDVACAFGVPAPGAAPVAAIVVANILANPLVMLAPLLAAAVAPGGTIALSGILEVQEDFVADAYRPWFTLAPWRRLDGWVLLAARRSP